jgi:ATP-dependent exoDNAse (exonuclease V) alpha subunit
MAIYRLQITPVSRASGRSATAAAAYRAGERIRDERTGTLYNHSKRTDVLHKEIFLPSRLDAADAAMKWARERATLWNAAEKAEQRSDSRVAREYQVALPPELSAGQRVALARTFSREIADRYNVAVDLAIHAPRPEGDPRNFHAHLLATAREVRPEGLGPKSGLDMPGWVRSELGLPPSRQEFTTLRARWADLTNEALRQANVEVRVDHRSLEAQGIDREPRPNFPAAAFRIERRGGRSEVAEAIRERYRQRVAARAIKAAEKGQESAPPRESTAPRESPVPQDMEARRRQAAQEWLNRKSASSLSSDEIRRRAVEAWRGRQARGAESQPLAASKRDVDAGRDPAQSGPGREAPGLDDDLS